MPKTENNALLFNKAILIISLVFSFVSLITLQITNFPSEIHIPIFIESVLLIIISFVLVFDAPKFSQKVRKIAKLIYIFLMILFFIASLTYAVVYSYLFFSMGLPYERVYFEFYQVIFMIWLNFLCGIGTFTITIFGDKIGRDKNRY